MLYVRPPPLLVRSRLIDLSHRDTPGARTLTGVYHVNGTGNTVESCIARCDAANFVYAAVEWGQVDLLSDLFISCNFSCTI
jgi:hypothetical protein